MNSIDNKKVNLFFDKMLDVCMSFVLSRSIYAIAKLQVAEALMGNTLHIEDLAKKIGVKHAGQLERVLNFLVSNNIFTKNSYGFFENTALSQNLLWSQSGKKIIDFQDKRWHLLGDASNIKALDFSEKLGLDGQFILARAIYIACKLGVFEDAVKGNKISPYVQKPLEEAGLIQKNTLTPLGELFLDSRCKSFVLHDTKARWDALGDLESAIVNGTVPFEKQQGMTYFEYLRAYPHETPIFSEAMTFISSYECTRLTPTFATLLQPGMTIMDVGGGQGLYLNEILTAYPANTGILFDLQENVEKHLLDTDIQSRCQIVGGNFFIQVPASDVYLFKRVLHDWSDEDVVKILTNCFESAKVGAQLVLHESLLPEPKALLFDVLFMSCISGKQRSKDTFKQLVEKSGWTFVSATSTNCWLSQILAVKS